MAQGTSNPTVAFRPSMTAQWWAVGSTVGGKVSWSIVQATTRPTQLGPAVGPFASKNAAQQWVNTIGGGAQPGTGPVGNIISNLNPANWLASLGGDIASGLEGGIVQLLKDLWAVIVGPLEVIAGILIALFVLVIYFKNDVASLISLAGM